MYYLLSCLQLPQAYKWWSFLPWLRSDGYKKLLLVSSSCMILLTATVTFLPHKIKILPQRKSCSWILGFGSRHTWNPMCTSWFYVVMHFLQLPMSGVYIMERNEEISATNRFAFPIDRWLWLLAFPGLKPLHWIHHPYAV